MAASVHSAALRGAVWMFAAKIVTFVLNLAVIRRVNAAVFGVVSVELDLYLSTVLFLAREAVRRVAIRHDAVRDARQIVQLSWLAAALGTVLAALALPLFADTARADASAHYAALVLYGLAAVLELLGEAAFNLVQGRMLFAVRGIGEMVALLLRAVAIAGLVYGAGWAGYAPFVIGQLLQSAATSVILTAALVRGADAPLAARDLLPSASGMLLAARTHWRLFAGFQVQSVLKLVLAKGEHLFFVFVLAADGAVREQMGTYAAVSHLGSLVVRLVFAVVEEQAFTTFSKETDAARRGALLAIIVRAMGLLGLLFAAFGPPYAFYVVHLLYGASWSDGDAPLLLGHYAVYVAVLGINGVLEAFVHAVATKDQLGRLNRLLVVNCAVQLASAYVLLPVFGVSGLILANGLAMLVRIGQNVSFVRWHQPAVELHAALPLPVTLGAYALAALAARAVSTASWTTDLAVGAVAVGLVLLTVARFEQDAVRSLATVLRSKEKRQ